MAGKQFNKQYVDEQIAELRTHIDVSFAQLQKTLKANKVDPQGLGTAIGKVVKANSDSLRTELAGDIQNVSENLQKEIAASDSRLDSLDENRILTGATRAVLTANATAIKARADDILLRKSVAVEKISENASGILKSVFGK